MVLLFPWLCKGMVLGWWDAADLLLSGTSGVLLATPYLLYNQLWFRKWYWATLGLLVLIWSLMESIYLIKDKVAFNHLALRIFVESFPQELKGYFTHVIPLPILLGAIGAITGLLYLYLSVSHQAPVLGPIGKRQWAILASSCLMIQVFEPLGLHSRWGVFRNTYTAVAQVCDYYSAMDKSPQEIRNELQNIGLQQNTLPRTWVLLIGESSSRHHWSAYGYWRNTTPRLAIRKDLVWYHNVISSHTSTVESLSRCLTLNVNGDNRHDFSDLNIADIANACGIKTWWISTHHRHGLLHSSVPEAMQRAKVVQFLEEDFPGSSMPHDEWMLPYLRAALADKSPRKLIMLHLMGTHLPYQHRYPDDFERFTDLDSVRLKYPFAETLAKQKVINAYDNATYYQDYVLDLMLNQLDSARQKGQSVSALYFSDHGEEIYDYRDFIGHTPQSNTAWLHDIPFFTWGLPSSGNEYKPYQLHCLGYTLLEWLHLGSPLHRPDKSIFNPQLHLLPRRLGNGQLYDTLRAIPSREFIY
jgi:heptose-I-phosphate ethanolaminephosphotransferase